MPVKQLLVLLKSRSVSCQSVFSTQRPLLIIFGGPLARN